MNEVLLTNMWHKDLVGLQKDPVINQTQVAVITS